MRNLFRSFEGSGLEYLLISGQASVLYGAATFSEDVDIWVRPTNANVRRMRSALATCRARVYKLTPPLEARFLKGGHAFHFVIPFRPLPVFLDVMGRPPRADPFETARRRARRLRTRWGVLPVVAIEDLVRIKKTRRLSDYEVISRLARIRTSESTRPAPALLRWAARNSFQAADRVGFLRRLGRRASLERCRRAIAREISAHQRRDSSYWRPILAELRRLRREGKLVPEGTPVVATAAGA